MSRSLEGATPLLRDVMRRWWDTADSPETFDESRGLFQRGFDALPEEVKALTGAATYPVALSPTLAALQTRMTEAVNTGPR